MQTFCISQKFASLADLSLYDHTHMHTSCRAESLLTNTLHHCVCCEWLNLPSRWATQRLCNGCVMNKGEDLADVGRQPINTVSQW